MQQMIDEDGNLWTVGADGAPVFAGRAPSQAPAPPQQSGPAPFTVGKPRAPEPKAPYRWQSNDGSLMEMGPDGVPRVAYQDTPKPNSRDGKSLRQGDGDKLTALIDQYVNLKSAALGFQDNFAGNTIGGEMENWAQGIFGTGTPGQRDWWSAFRATDNLIRNDLFGASLTDGEKRAYEQTTVSPSMTPAEVRRNVERRVEIARKALERRVDRFRAAGFDNAEIEALVGESAPDLGIDREWKQSAPAFHLGPSQRDVPDAFLPQGGDGGDGPQGPTVLPDARGARGDNVRVGDESGVTGAGKGLVREPRLAGVGQELLAMVQAGRSRKDVFGYADKRFREVGFPGISPGQSKALDYAIRMRAANPSKPVTNFVTGWENYEMVPDTNSGAGARAMGAVATFEPGGVPVGNTLTHFTNAAAAGLPTYMAGDNGADVMAAARRTMPVSSAIGDVGGSVASMVGINKLGGLLAASGRPGVALVGNALTKGGGIGGDVAYSATRGGVENGPVGAITNALAGAAGNKIGGGFVGTVGRGVRGVSDSAVDYLSSRGIPLTTGQLLGNRSVAGRVMNKLESMPFLGDNLAARRAESMAAYNRAALEDAGSRINFTPNDTGYKGVELGLDAAGNAIENAVSGVDVPIDPTARTDIANIIGDAQRTLTPDYAQKYAQVVSNRINPAISGPNITGEAYQQAMRGIKRYRAGAGADGFEQDFRDSLTSMGDALTNNITRQAGPDVAQNLAKANQAYRDFSLIQKATEKAQSGNQSGLPEIFTPSQLQQAVRSSKYAKSGTSEPFYELNTAAQDILPSTIPNTGSADRGIASWLVPAGLATGGAAASYYDPKIAAPLIALTLLSTKGGAKVVQKALTGRSPAAKALGTKIFQQRRKAGLFGASAAQAMVPYLSQ